MHFITMKKPIQIILLALVMLMNGMMAMAQSFDEYFEDNTLRLDYIFAGNAQKQSIYLEDLKKQDRWAGRKNRLSEKFLNGNGQVTVRDHATQKVIYVTTFSSLFQGPQSALLPIVPIVSFLHKVSFAT